MRQNIYVYLCVYVSLLSFSSYCIIIAVFMYIVVSFFRLTGCCSSLLSLLLQVPFFRVNTVVVPCIHATFSWYIARQWAPIRRRVVVPKEGRKIYAHQYNPSYSRMMRYDMTRYEMM